MNVSIKYYLTLPPETKKHARIRQHISHNSSESVINGHRIIVQNEGTFCPNNCTSKINIINNNNKTVWTHESLDTYVMKPITFAFNSSDIFGFVFKIWEHEYEVIHLPLLMKWLIHFLFLLQQNFLCREVK